MERSVYITIRGDEISVEARQEDGQAVGAVLSTTQAPVGYIESPPRFAKLDANGNVLADDAPDWAGVLDRQTQLIWSPDDACPPTNWDASKKAAEAATLCGGPARMPTPLEEVSIRDYGRCDPALDTRYFRNVSSRGYWTSSVLAGDPTCAWVVNGGNGSVDWGHRDSECCVRAVRSVAPAAGQ